MKLTRFAAYGLGSFLLVAACLAAPAAAQDSDTGTDMRTFWQHDPDEPDSWFNPRNWTAGVPNERMDAFVTNGGTAIICEKSIDPTWNGLDYGAVARSLALTGPDGGAIDHCSGVLRIVGDLRLDGCARAGSSYALADGNLSAANVYIHSGWPYHILCDVAPWPANVFKQAGGSSEVRGRLHVGGAILPMTRPDGSIANEADVLGGIDPEYFYRPGAAYDLSGGTLSAGAIYVGYGGKGRFSQSEGTNKVAGALFVGGGLNTICPVYDGRPAPDSLVIYPWYYDEGTYALSGGRLSARSVHVGQRGRGNFVQSGGAHMVESTLQVGGNWWWWPRPIDGTYTNPAPGEAEMTSVVMPEYYVPAVGTYVLSNGELGTGNTEVGIGGTGRFIQSGGVHKIGGALRIGGHPCWLTNTIDDPAGRQNCIVPPPYPGPCRGSYELSGGELYAPRVEISAGYAPWPYEYDPVITADAGTSRAVIAPWMPASFRQTGGEATVFHALSVRGGSCELIDGTLTADSMYLTGWYIYDHSRFTQSGGTCYIRERLQIGTEYYPLRAATDEEIAIYPPPYCGWETVALTGGELHAGDIEVVGAGTARLVQSGGELTTHKLRIAGRDATYRICRGALNAGILQVGWLMDTTTSQPPSYGSNAPGSRLSIAGRETKINVTGMFTLGAHGRFDAADGSTIRMTGADFQNYSIDPRALEGLDHLRLVFTIGPTDDNRPETFEVAGKDLGFVRHGFWNNFVLHTLQVGAEDVGWVQLVDFYDNQPTWDGREALYVRQLIVTPGSKLDLNGLNLYYLRGKIAEDGEVVGGSAARFVAPGWAIECDTNLDGSIDFFDYVTTKGNFGLAAGATWEHGDTDEDGDVDFADYLTVKGHFGERMNWDAGNGSIPEPGAVALLAVGALALLRRRRR